MFPNVQCSSLQLRKVLRRNSVKYYHLNIDNTCRFIFTVCGAAYYMNSDTSTCEVCPLNTWKSTPGNQACTPCGGGLITQQTGSEFESLCGLYFFH